MQMFFLYFVLFEADFLKSFNKQYSQNISTSCLSIDYVRLWFLYVHPKVNEKQKLLIFIIFTYFFSANALT